MPETNGPMTIAVSLRSILARYRPDPKNRKPFPVELPSGATVADLLAKLRIDEKLTHLVFVDHVRRQRTDPLADGAAVDIFPPIAGG